MSHQVISIVATVIGPDRPGLVELLSKTISRHEGNWEESRLAHLAGQFAGMLRIQIAETALPPLESDLKALAAEGLQVSVTRGEPDEHPSAEPLSFWNLNIVGQDRSGLVKEISRILVRHGLNVEELKTQCESAPMSGETLFRATARLSGPRGTETDDIRSALETIGPDMMVELETQD